MTSSSSEKMPLLTLPFTMVVSVGQTISVTPTQVDVLDGDGTVRRIISALGVANFKLTIDAAERGEVALTIKAFPAEVA